MYDSAFLGWINQYITKEKTLKRIFVLSFVVCTFLFATTALADKSNLPPHMSGIGMFTWQETVGVNPHTFAKDAKEKGLSFVIIKSHDGSSWGTRKNGKWQPAISKELVSALHKERLRAYSYFTARLTNSNSVKDSVALAVRTLNMGVDGVVVDDLGLFGKSKTHWTNLFSDLRREVNKRKGTVLAFSSFPHLMKWKDAPWAVALKYSDYFLPQSYWRLFQQMSPENSLAYTQANFDALRAYNPEYEKCTLVPVGMSYGKNVTAKQIDTFLTAAKPYYEGVALFRWSSMPKGGWNIIKKQADGYKPGRTLKSISLIDAFRHPPKVDGKKSKSKKNPGSHKANSPKKMHEWPGH